MKLINPIIVLSCLLVTSLLNSQIAENNPQPFLPEIITKYPNVRDVAMYKDEIYFTIQSYQEELSAIVMVRKENNKYASPVITTFSGMYNDLEPFVSSDGLRLYFASNRPLDSTKTQVKDFDIWYVSRLSIQSEWSAPIHLPEPINTEFNEFYPSVSNNLNLYYTSDRTNSKGKDDIFFSSFIDGVYHNPISLSDSINSVGYEFNAYVAPDESFLIFTAYNRADGFGSGDLYLSYKNKQGEWLSAQNMGSLVNSDKMDYCPFVDLKGSVLYFTSLRNLLNTHFSEPQSIDSWLKECNIYQNGLSRLYKIPFKAKK